MGFAVPGYIEHRFSMHLCEVGQCQHGNTYCHQSSHIQIMSAGAFLFIQCRESEVYDRFDTGYGPLYMAIPSESPTAKERCDVLGVKFLC